MLRQARRIIPAGIILFWLVMMGLLAYHEVIIPRTHAGNLGAGAEVPQDHWLGVYLGDDQRVGFIHARAQPEERDGVPGQALKLTVSVEMTLFKRDTSLFLTGTAWRSVAPPRADFDFSLKSGQAEMRIVGTLADGELKAKLHTGNEITPFTFPVDDNLLFSGGMGLSSVTVPILEPGEEIYVDAFDPTTMSVGQARIHCQTLETVMAGGKPYETLLISTTVGGVTSKTWITEGGELIRAETPFGFVLEKISPRDALKPVDPDEQVSVINQLAVKPTGKKPFRGARRMHIRFSGVGEDVLPTGGDRQRKVDDGYIIETPVPPEAALAALAAADAEPYLGGDALVNTGHPRIEKAVASALGEADGPWAKALQLHEWVFETLEKVPVISVPSALDVLRTKQGDCNEHTVLFAAMARTAGIPTRIAIGLVWSDEIDGFGYHAWPEVYAGRWIPMDPTLDQPVADATHIKLLTGSIDQWGRLVNYIGQLEVEVLAVE